MKDSASTTYNANPRRRLFLREFFLAWTFGRSSVSSDREEENKNEGLGEHNV